jgi:hypothetical protein
MAGSSRVRSVRLTVACLSAALALLAGGCGSTQLTRGTPAAKVFAPALLSDRWPLAEHILSPDAFPGFAVPRHAPVISGLSAWAAIQQPASQTRAATRLRTLGFVRAIDEQFDRGSPSSAQAVSIAEEFRTTAGARAELAYQSARLGRTRDLAVSAFPVGIPNGRGVRTAGGDTVGLHVLFVVGRYYYTVAEFYRATARRTPTAARLAAAAGSLYLAVMGCAAPSGVAGPLNLKSRL